MNVLAFSGNLGNDAKQAFSQAGKSIISFNVACNSGWGDKKKTAWVKCVLFGDRGESLLPYLKKGQKVEVVGQFQMGDEWTNKDGKTVSQPECVITNVDLAGSKTERTEPAPRKQAADDYSMDVPF